jgi:hypothetical protein
LTILQVRYAGHIDHSHQETREKNRFCAISIKYHPDAKCMMVRRIQMQAAISIANGDCDRSSQIHRESASQFATDNGCK